MVERDRVQLPLHGRVGEDRLDLGGEDQARGIAVHVQRFDAQAITGQEKAAAPLVPDREGEHAPELLEAARTERLVQAEHDLGVAARPEGVAVALQDAAKLPVVVDLAVEDDPALAVRARHRLVPALEVNDAEPPHAERPAGKGVDPLVVRAPVRQRSAHRREHLRLDDAVPVEVRHPDYPAHCAATPSRRPLARPGPGVQPKARQPKWFSTWTSRSPARWHQPRISSFP